MSGRKLNKDINYFNKGKHCFNLIQVFLRDNRHEIKLSIRFRIIKLLRLKNNLRTL